MTTKNSKIKNFFEKDGFLYDIYQEEELLDKEMTQYAVKKYKAYYKCYQNLEIGNENDETKSRRQVSTPGCYLTQNNNVIDIAADILTSMYSPIKICMKELFNYNFSKGEFESSKKEGNISIADKDIFRKLRETNEGKLFLCIHAFIKVNHTIGNIMPIPEGLNTTWRTCLKDVIRDDLSFEDNADYKIRCLWEYFRLKDKKNLKEKYAKEVDDIEKLIKNYLVFFAREKYKTDKAGDGRKIDLYNRRWCLRLMAYRIF